MAKYIIANPLPYTTLKWNPYQVAFLQALALRSCPKCHKQFSVRWGVIESLACPDCATAGEREYNVLTLIAGRQGGKTRIGTLACALESSFAGSRGWVCAPTFRDQEDFVKPAFFQQIPQDWLDSGDWQASNDLFVLPNRSTAAFRSLDNPDAVRGPTLDWLLIDEACKVSGKAFHTARPALSTTKGVIILTTTPKGQDWVYEDAWQPADQGVPGFWAARYKSIENPVQSAAFIEQQRRTMSPEMFAQEYEADFVTFQGAIYGSLVNPCIALDDDPRIKEFLPEWPKIDPSRPCVFGLDPGTDHPFAGVLIVFTPRGAIQVAEYKQRNKSAMEHAGNLKRIAGGLRPRWAIDRSQAQMMIELAQWGIFAQAAENSVEAGIERVKAWMLSGQYLIVKSRCPETVKELQAYRWKDNERPDGSIAKAEPYKRNDDLCDAKRYGFMLWPELPKPREVLTTRDISKLPEKTQREIERILRFEGKKEDVVADGVGDFFEKQEDEPYREMGMFEEMI